MRASDSQLTARMTIEFRADQKSYDIVHMTTVNKLPPQMLAQVDPPEAKNISASARDPNRRWYGVYANYNAPAYNTQLVKASELPKSYEELAQRKEWAGKVAIDGTDNEWLPRARHPLRRAEGHPARQGFGGDAQPGDHRRASRDGARDRRRRILRSRSTTT